MSVDETSAQEPYGTLTGDQGHGQGIASPPRDALGRAAERILRRFCAPSIVEHSFRSYYWAAEHARIQNLPFDAPILYLAAMTHDLGLCTTFDSTQAPFEEVGAAFAWSLALAHGWDEELAARAEEVAVRHMRADVSPADDVEAHLLQVGTSADVSGLRVEEFPPRFIDDLHRSHPRLGFDEEFIEALEGQGARKPDCAAAGLVSIGIADRIRGNGLPR